MEQRSGEMLVSTSTRQHEIFELTLESVDGKFKILIKVSKVEKDILLQVRHPDYLKLVEMYKHLQGVDLLGTENKEEYPIHVILGASEYSSIKMGVVPIVGRIGEPMAELTWLGLVIMSPGCGVESSMYLTHTSQ